MTDNNIENTEKKISKSTSNTDKAFSVVKGILLLITVALIARMHIEYKISPLKAEIEHLKQNTIKVKVFNEDAVLGLFANEGYDMQTQFEYLDILKILLKRNNILVVKSESVKFNIHIAELNVHSIDVLRSSLVELGIDNPRIGNEQAYAEREQTQRDLINQLMKMPNI